MEEVKEQPQVVGTQPLIGKRGRPKLMLFDEERKERRRLMHREIQRRSNKKLMTDKNKMKRHERQRKARERLDRFLLPLAKELIRQEFEREQQPALKQTKEELAKCKRQIESLMKCANNLFDEVKFTKKQATNLCEFLSDMPAGEE
jgi:hypothetical protein